jgi:hypothetical protein
MKDKKELRQIMKALYIAQGQLDIIILGKKNNIPDVSTFAACTAFLMRVKYIPASYFKHDKPEIDKRRSMRHFNKSKAALRDNGSRVVTINANTMSGDDLSKLTQQLKDWANEGIELDFKDRL